MAGPRVVSTRRLCSRYKYSFYIAIVILGIQAFLGYSFYSIKEQEPNDKTAHHRSDDDLSQSYHPEKLEIGKTDMGKFPISNSSDKLINKTGGTGPPHSKEHKEGKDLLKESTFALADSTHFLKYTPKCEVTGREAISAITRARTIQCKQELADVACLHVANKLYSINLPRFCHLKGNNSGQYFGCFKDNIDDRDLDGSYLDTEENSPDKCIQQCLRGGFNYAGVQYGRECWCGDVYGKHGNIEETYCGTKCPSEPNTTCGGYLANRIFATGFGKTERQQAPLTTAPSNVPKAEQVRIAFVLTLNGRQVRQVVRLLRTIYHPNHYYYIHVDSRQEYMFRELLSLEERLDNVMLTRKRFATIWGGASLLQAHLSFLQELLRKTEWKWDYFINLSESDYPIKTVLDLTNYLTAYKGLNFLKSHGKDTPRFIKKQGLDQTFYECENHLWRIGRRHLPNGIRVDGGSDWICLYRDFVRYIIDDEDELLQGLKTFYKYTLLPAESFFHTVLQNSRFCSESVDNNLHLTNWRRKQGCKCQYKHIVDWCGCSPNDFKINDLEKLLKYEDKPLFFARKFEPVVNQEIINSLDVYLFGHLQQGMVGLTSYWQNEYHHQDIHTKTKDAYLTFYHSFMRLNLEFLVQQYSACRIRPLELLEVNLFYESDHFHGLLVLYKTEHLTTGQVVTLEIHVHPKHYSSVLDPKGAIGRLQYLEVGSDFDPKELIFRNYGRLLGPYDELVLRHIWGPGKELTVSVAWIDPANIIAASYDIKITGSTFVGSHKPALNRPIRPGVWTVKLMYNMVVVAETQFLVTPLTFYQGSPISVSHAHRSHSGPIGMYTSKDFSELRGVLQVPHNQQLMEEAEANGKKVGHDLELWIDSLVPLFWVVKEACSVENIDICGIQDCHKNSWSSRSLDPKSDIQAVGSKLPFVR